MEGKCMFFHTDHFGPKHPLMGFSRHLRVFVLAAFLCPISSPMTNKLNNDFIAANSIVVHMVPPKRGIWESPVAECRLLFSSFA
jgi:hypothetical protein